MPRFNHPKKNSSKKNKYNSQNKKLPFLSENLPKSEVFQKSQWVVREVMAKPDKKNYICPGCNQTISAQSAHVVVWPEESIMGKLWEIEQRRHWHSGCWRHRKYGG